MNKKDKKKSSFQFVPKGPSIWIFLIVFVSAWMFVLGVLVGRDSAPVKFDIEKLQKELVALKEAVIKREQKRFKIDSDVVKNKTDFGFYEALKETKKYKNNGAGISDKQETIHLSQNNTVEVKEKVIPDNAKVNIVKQKDLIETDKTLTIQVASLKDSKDADEMVAKLQKKGYPVYRISINIPEKGIWHRVRIGYFKDKAEASSTLNKLKEEKYRPILVNR
ncbi:MAG: SPOR domain-containing protein [Proteobacteria bacterium]|nr:SPOR domain-containing protein [Pseudomonadota bacterium]MBU4289409.1 SPOR domain-containing protein [Pseudomonadota bacterium]MBU4413673.1 SPOR domain-containing protein [Pseudomonadota bacterium]MCG2757935.1 SPOR domain-containing protein [Desulfobacteraceae bacterium]